MEERQKPSIPFGVEGALMLAGILLFVTSFVWPRIDDPRSAWTEDKSTALQDAAARSHGLSFRDLNDPEIKKQYDQAQSEYRALDAQLQYARTRGTRTAFWLKISGGVLAAVGGVGFFLQRDAS